MHMITNSQHEYKVGRFVLNVGNSDITIHDKTDNFRCIMTEDMTTKEMAELAKALFYGAVLREKCKEMLTDELLEDERIDQLLGGDNE